jgi:biotin operon repressor
MSVRRKILGVSNVIDVVAEMEKPSFNSTPFVKLPHSLLTSIADAKLRPIQIAVLLRLVYRYHGGNNGFIAASQNDLRAELSVSKESVGRALKVLQAKGFIVMEREYPKSPRRRMASEYRLTWLPHAEGMPPTLDFLKL